MIGCKPRAPSCEASGLWLCEWDMEVWVVACEVRSGPEKAPKLPSGEMGEERVKGMIVIGYW